MRVALIISRYGEEIVGGAESVVRDLAEHMVVIGHEITVLTTCVRDHFEWSNHYAPGAEVIRGVRVERYPVRPRDHIVMRRLQGALDAGLTLPDHLQREWVRNCGYSDALLEGIDSAAADHDALVFAQYLFAPTVFGALRHPERSLVMPLLHDEAYARFNCVGEVLRGVAGLLFLSPAERDAALRLWGPLPPQRVVGAGVETDDAPPDVSDWRSRRGIAGDIVTFAGRREAAKGFPLLAESVVAHNLAHVDAPVTLVTMGGGDVVLPDRARGQVIDLGFVSLGERRAAMAASLAVANLSLFESFSLVVMEAWTLKVPVIVNADCAVTRRACEESGAGLWIRSPEEFAVALERLRADPDLRRRMGQAGRAFVAQRYSWPAVLERFSAAVRELSVPAA